MKIRMLKWAGMMLGGSTLFAAGVQGCMDTFTLRIVIDAPNQVADRPDGSNEFPADGSNELLEGPNVIITNLFD